jgi:hypothetical protein
MTAGKSPRGGHPRLVAVLLSLATLVTLVAIFSIWANRQALDTDNWVNTSGRLLANEKIDQQLSTYLAEQLASHDNLKTTMEAELPERLQPLGSAVANGLRQLAPQIAERVLENPNFQKLWAGANRVAHERLLEVLDGGGSTVSTEGGEVFLDLRPLITQVGKEVGIGVGAAENLPPDAGRLLILKSDQLSAAQEGAHLVRELPIVLTLLALVLFGLAVFVAGPRRREALRGVGIGFFVAGLLVLILRTIGGNALVGALVTNPSAKPAAHAAWGISTSLLATVASSTLAFGVLVFLAAWLAGPTALATGLRREASPWVRRHRSTAYGVTAVVFLLLVAWAPVAAFRKPLGILLLALLMAAGAELLRRQIVRENPDYEGGRLRWPGGAGDGGEERVAELERLAALRQDGSLTEGEFAAAKQAILVARDGPA